MIAVKMWIYRNSIDCFNGMNPLFICNCFTKSEFDKALELFKDEKYVAFSDENGRTIEKKKAVAFFNKIAV